MLERLHFILGGYVGKGAQDSDLQELQKKRKNIKII